MKLHQFQQRLTEAKIPTALFLAGESLNPGFVYFTPLPQLTHSALLIPANGKLTLFVSSLDYGRAVKESRIKKIVLVETSFLQQIKRQLHSPRIGIDFSATSYSAIKELRKITKKPSFINIASILQDIRSTKTKEEVALLAKAAQIANSAFTSTIHNFHYKTEADVKAALEYEMLKQGAMHAFPTIIASGKNAAIPHHRTTSQKLQKGFCVIDFGANYQGYRSDCTRTIFIGKPSAKDKRLYNLVLNAQQAALKTATVGTPCSQLDTTARNKLGPMKKYFIHSLGHGIGIEIHESPSLSQKSTAKLQKGMVVTIEPGIYIPNKLGIRIEDTILITSGSPRILTNIPKNLIATRA